MEVREDSRILFKTGAGRKTEHNVDCRVQFLLRNCSRLTLSCRLKMKGRGRNCSRGDRLAVSHGGETLQ